MIHSIDAESYIIGNPVTFYEDTDLFQAIHVLLEQKLTGATVINYDNEIIGVISELDCLKAILDGAYYGQVGGSVGDYMTRSVQTIEHSEGLDILAVAKLMIDGKRRRLPIVAGGKFIGQVSCRSILQAVKDFVAEHDPSEDSVVE